MQQTGHQVTNGNKIASVGLVQNVKPGNVYAFGFSFAWFSEDGMDHLILEVRPPLLKKANSQLDLFCTNMSGENKVKGIKKWLKSATGAAMQPNHVAALVAD